MPEMRYSKQRERIREILKGRRDHPTADMVYESVRKEFPNISLATVYRNLSLLSELGQVRKITTADGADRFDGDCSPHYHLFCNRCHGLTDINMNPEVDIDDLARRHSKGLITGHDIMFFGVCEGCTEKMPDTEEQGADIGSKSQGN